MDKLGQIAQKAGVSPNTVLRILRGENKEVWPSAIRRAEQIRCLAKEMAYMPNGSARAMRRGRFNCVSLLLSDERGRSYLPQPLFDAIHDALSAQGMRLIVSKLPDAQLTSEEVLPSILREWSCDGLLINYTDRVPPQMSELIDRYRIPSLWINRRQESDCVYYDDLGGAKAATEYLIGLGHRRIAYLDFVADGGSDRVHYSRPDRYAGYAQAMRAAGLVPDERGRFAGTAVGERLGVLQKLMTSQDRPTAIISYDAGDRLLYAAALAGLRVPEDISLLCFGMQHTSLRYQTGGEMFIGRSVGVARLPAEKVGAAAVEMLLQKMAEPGVKLPPTVVNLELEPGDTCGRAPHEGGMP